MTSNHPRFYAQPGLHVELYDLMTGTGWCSLHRDIPFYIDQTMANDGAVLELACGTGRVSIPLAAAGLEVHGVDSSSPMLARAQSKRKELGLQIQNRLHFHQGRMEDFNLEKKFGTILLPFRSFQILLQTEAQLDCLACIRKHLAPRGRVILNLFDPRYEFLAPGAGGPTLPRELRHPESGHRVTVQPLQRHNDPLSQTFRETWEFCEYSRDGQALRRESESICLKWTFRQEMRLLAELAGFSVIAEYSDFNYSPPAYGAEQIWILQAKA